VAPADSSSPASAAKRSCSNQVACRAADLIVFFAPGLKPGGTFHWFAADSGIPYREQGPRPWRTQYRLDIGFLRAPRSRNEPWQTLPVGCHPPLPEYLAWCRFRDRSTICTVRRDKRSWRRRRPKRRIKSTSDVIHPFIRDPERYEPRLCKAIHRITAAGTISVNSLTDLGCEPSHERARTDGRRFWGSFLPCSLWNACGHRDNCSVFKSLGGPLLCCVTSASSSISAGG